MDCIIRWLHGKALLWDSTIGVTLTPSYLRDLSETPAFVVELAERHKHNHYIDPASRSSGLIRWVAIKFWPFEYPLHV